MKKWHWRLGLAALLAAGAAHADDPWADEVVDFDDTGCNTGFCTPEKTLGPPLGGGLLNPGLTSLHSLGTAGSYITLKFNTPVTDDPANPDGLDFIVFGNGHYVAGNPQRRWMEPGLVEISRDANNNGIADDPWYYFPGTRGITPAEIATGIPNPALPLAAAAGVLNPNSTDGTPGNDNEEYDWGYADMAPVDTPYLDRYLRPDDPRTVGLSPGSGGGDAFDIAWAVDAMGQPANLTEFSFIRIRTMVQGVAVGPITTEIDAVADVPPAVDSDGDGILDEYETRVAGTDPLRKESTVLALEIPASAGGSAVAGTLLGEASDGNGNRIRLRSKGTRSGVREFNAVVDIVPAVDPGDMVPGRIKSAAVVRFESSVPDFQAAQVANAEFTIHYNDSDIAGLHEAALQPWRHEGSGWTQAGISNIALNASANTVTFTSRYPGTFVLASLAGNGNGGGPAEGVPVSGRAALVALCVFFAGCIGRMVRARVA